MGSLSNTFSNQFICFLDTLLCVKLDAGNVSAHFDLPIILRSVTHYNSENMFSEIWKNLLKK